MSQYRWLRDYEKRRFKEPNESWACSRYGAMDWREAQQVYLPPLKMNVGQAWNRLKKLWKNYKISGRTGQYRGDVAYEIIRLQAALDIPRSDLPETEGISDYEFEDQDQEIYEKRSVEDEVLRCEEAEAKAEAEDDDCWMSHDD